MFGHYTGDPIADHRNTERDALRWQEQNWERCEGGCEERYPRLVTFRSIDGTREKECCRSCFESLREDETASIVRGMDY